MSLITHIASECIRRRIWTAGTLACFLLLSYRTLGISPSPIVVAMALCLSLAVYVMDAAGPQRILGPHANARHVVDRLLFRVAAVAFGALVLVQRGPAGLILVGVSCAGLLYAVPISLGRTRRLHLRGLPTFKSIWLALLIAAAAVGLPLTSGRPSTSARLLLDIVLCSICALSNVTLCDLPDVTEDRAAGVKTLPILLGVNTTRWALALLNVGAAAVLMVWMTLSGHAPGIVWAWVFVALATAVLSLASGLRAMQRRLKPLAEGVVVPPVIVVMLVDMCA
ncbi:MAG: hypothetical protein GF331_04765 [Chitinivibrionales bacterium]|nr:hypothetical protein [Chitinivibrionales bacterium]